MAQHINILIVDDLELVHEPIKRFLIDFVFVTSNPVITSAYNVNQARRELGIKKYDLVMLDGDIGGNWGHEIIQNIKAHNENVIIISSSNLDDFNQDNVNMGADAQLNKTFLYAWNDENGAFRKQHAEMIQKLFKEKHKSPDSL